MYKKRKRTPVNIQQLKDDLRAEVKMDVMSMLASEGVIVPSCRNPSPALGRRSSCASTSQPGGREEEDAAVCEGRLKFEPIELYEDPLTGDDTIDRLAEPTQCGLLVRIDGH